MRAGCGGWLFRIFKQVLTMFCRGARRHTLKCWCLFSWRFTRSSLLDPAAASHGATSTRKPTQCARRATVIIWSCAWTRRALGCRPHTARAQRTLLRLTRSHRLRRRPGRHRQPHQRRTTHGWPTTQKTALAARASAMSTRKTTRYAVHVTARRSSWSTTRTPARSRSIARVQTTTRRPRK